MLTREEAQKLILTRINAHQDARDFFIVEHRTVERPFGWVFFVAVRGPSATTPTETVHRLIIVNKYVAQIIESSIEYTPARLIEIYESLLAKSQASEKDWCLTMSFPLPWRDFGRGHLANKAKEMGLYEIK